MRRVNESSTILQLIASATGQPTSQIERVVSALRDAIDGLFLDGYTVFAPPFSLTYRNDPVGPIFAEHFEEATDADFEAWYLGDMEATAAWLGLPVAEYMRHPVASELRVLTELLDGLEIENADSPEGVETVTIARAWFDTFTEERPYRLSDVGLERDLEAWLIHHTERLDQIGYDVRLHRQQLILPDRRRPDLVFDLVEDNDGPPGTLIVELKATSAYLAAVDQLVGYMDTFASLGLAKGVLRGLLVADGFPPEVLSYAREKGINTATLTELGYRRDLAANRATTQGLIAPQSSTGPETAEQKVTDTYVVTGMMDDDNTPLGTVLFKDGKYVGGTWDGVRSRIFQPEDKGLTIDDIESSFQMFMFTCQGRKVPGRRVDLRGETGVKTAEQEGDTVPRVYRMFHGMDTNRTEPQATLAFGENDLCRWVSREDAFATFFPQQIYTLTLDQIAASMSSRVFVPVLEDDPEYVHATQAAPAYVSVWEASDRATVAAADFLRAVAELSNYAAGVPPRALANYFRRKPDELNGDDDLPDYIDAAADAMEGLPRAVIDWQPPDHYDGSTEEFLLDATHLFNDVAKRFLRLAQRSDSSA